MKTLQEKIEAGREYRNMVLRKAENLEESEEKKYIVEGYASTFNEPYFLFRNGDFDVYEQVDNHAFDECDMSDVIFQYDHEGRVFARTRNKTMTLSCDDHGLKVVADLGGTDSGRQLFGEIEGGYIDRMSFGFIVTDSFVTRSTVDGKARLTRTITKIGKLFDVSAVSFPANDGTEISARSFCEGVIADAKKEILERKRKELAIRLKLTKE